MITISLCMIVKNEEKVLKRCLESIKDAVDEIIIVDTGSTDQTKEIAAEFTDKIYDFQWVDDFSKARNYAFTQATMDYQMWLDADDVVPAKSIEEIKKLKSTLSPDVDIVTMKYFTNFDQSGVPIFSSTRERLLKREKNYKWEGTVHECIPLIGHVIHSEIEIWHKKEDWVRTSTRNLDIYESLEISDKEFSPRDLYYFARELKDHGKFEKSAIYFEKFLNSKKGWVEDNIASCFSLAACYNALDQKEKVLPILFKSFTYDAPRAEICCEIGYYYKNIGNYATAFKWFDIAANLPKPDSIGFISIDYWGYIPNIEACVCLSHMGQYMKAYDYNERAGELKPNNSSVEHNRLFLTAKINQVEENN